jgi:hypothetical protein
VNTTLTDLRVTQKFNNLESVIQYSRASSGEATVSQVFEVSASTTIFYQASSQSFGYFILSSSLPGGGDSVSFPPSSRDETRSTNRV